MLICPSLAETTTLLLFYITVYFVLFGVKTIFRLYPLVKLFYFHMLSWLKSQTIEIARILPNGAQLWESGPLVRVSRVDDHLVKQNSSPRYTPVYNTQESCGSQGRYSTINWPVHHDPGPVLYFQYSIPIITLWNGLWYFNDPEAENGLSKEYSETDYNGRTPRHHGVWRPNQHTDRRGSVTVIIRKDIEYYYRNQELEM